MTDTTLEQPIWNQDDIDAFEAVPVDVRPTGFMRNIWLEAFARHRIQSTSEILTHADALAEALEAFAEVQKGHYSAQKNDMPIVAGFHEFDLRFNLKLGDFRKARTALKAWTQYRLLARKDNTNEEG